MSKVLYEVGKRVGLLYTVILMYRFHDCGYCYASHGSDDVGQAA